MRIIDTVRQRMSDAAIERATRKLSNHMRRDIGLPERHEMPTLPNFRV